MKKTTIISNSINDTIQIAKDLASNIESGSLILLEGELGVGKTAFTKGIALGLDINDTITSPTFTLLKEYEGRMDLKHIDAYRLEGVSSDSLGLYDLMDSNTVVVIEWADFIDSDLRPDYKVKIKYLEENSREIEIEEVN